MSDIIQDAKKLLEGATPGPWSIDGVPHPGPDDELFIHPKDDGGAIARVQPLYADAELIAVAPELAQALAEETWEYIVQVKSGDEWQFYIGESRFRTDEPGLAIGFSQRKDAQEFADADPYPARVLRRRVSPPEVVNE